MTQLPIDQSIPRFAANEERVDVFVNDPSSVGYYTTNETIPRQVESLPSLVDRIAARHLQVVYQGNWITSTSYSVNDLIEESSVVYICTTTHTAGTFATDLSAGKWKVFQANDASEQVYTAPFTGSVERTIENKFSDSKTFFDFGAVGDSITDDSSKITKAIDYANMNGNLILDGCGKTYLIDTANYVINKDNVLIVNATFKRTSAFTGWMFKWATTNDTNYGGFKNITLIGNNTIAASAGVGMGVDGAHAANKFILNNVIADSFGQYGIGIGSGSDWSIENISITNHGLVSGAISSCMGFYLFPTIASYRGKISNLSSELSSSVIANSSANTAACKLQAHFDAVINGLTLFGGREECLSIENCSGDIGNIHLRPQSGRPGLVFGNGSYTHDFAGKPLKIHDINIQCNELNNLALLIGAGESSKTIASIDHTTDTITLTGHGLKTNAPVVYLNSTNDWAGGLIPNTLYYLRDVTTDSFKLTKTPYGSPVSITSNGTGTQSIVPLSLVNTTLSNVKTDGAWTSLNRMVFNNCIFENIECSGISLSSASTGYIKSDAKSFGNIFRNVTSRPYVIGQYCALDIDESIIDNLQVLPERGSIVNCFKNINKNNSILNERLDVIQFFSTAQTVGDGLGFTAFLAGTSASNITMGDPYIFAINSSVFKDSLISAHPYVTGINYRVQNESGSSIDYPKTLCKVTKLSSKYIKTIAIESSYQWSGSNIADGAGLSKDVNCPCSLGDFVVFGWGSQFNNLLTSCYVKSTNTITCRIQNESGGASSVVTSTADLKVYVIDESRADCKGSKIYNPPSLADAEGVSIDVTCLGARIGDFALAAFTQNLEGMLLSATVSANDTVTVRIQNETGGVLDISSGILKTIVFKD
jgi:hypothetical protein